MAILTLHKSFTVRDGLSKPIMEFIQKLQDNPANPSLHVEHVNNSRDSRVRTGRVNKQYRAVMIEIHSGTEQHFLLLDVLNHDDAYQLAATVKMTNNPVTGVTQMEIGTANAELSSAEIDAEIDSRARRLAAERLAQQQAEAEAASAAAVSVVGRDAPAPRSTLAAAGITREDMENELGISPIAAGVVFAADSEHDLESLLVDSPAWELDAVLALVSGFTIDEVREELGLEKDHELSTTVVGDGVSAESTDDELLAGLQLPAARMEWAYGAGEEALRSIIETGDFNAWRIFVHPSQQAIINANFSGSGRVFGGAGTGKTVVAVHRANALVTSRGATPDIKDHPPRVLLTTFTRALSDSLKSQMNLLNPRFPEASTHGANGLWISGVDALVYRVLQNAQPQEINHSIEQILRITTPFSPKPLDDRGEKSKWEDAITLANVTLAPEKSNPEFLSQEYSTVVLGGDVDGEASYLRVPRLGRGTTLNRRERKDVWKIIEIFVRKCASDGRVTWPTLALLAAAVVEARGGNHLFDHIVIDEAQDFHVGHWRFLRACVPEGPNDIFLAEDSHQRIYGQRLVLSRYGISTRGRASRKLTLNYRTTHQNLDFALAILSGEQWRDSEDQVDTTLGYRSSRRGPAPIIGTAENAGEETALVVGQINTWLQESPGAHVGVLTRTNFPVKQIVAQLRDEGIDAVETRQATAAAAATVSVMTMHNSKGLEFTHVVLMGVSESSMPQKYQLNGLADAEAADVLQRERALLYVAASRARDALMVTTNGEPSQLLPA